MSSVSFPIPSETPSGQCVYRLPLYCAKMADRLLDRYLVRIEHIAIHSASYYGGAQVCTFLSVMLNINIFPIELISHSSTSAALKSRSLEVRNGAFTRH